MNEGHKVYSELSVAERESRLLRSGVEATLTPAGKRFVDTYASHATEKGHRQCYKILVYHLTVLHISLLGAGLGMRAATDNYNEAVSFANTESNTTGGRARESFAG